MGALAVGQSSSCATPVLDIFTSVNGVLTDVYILEYQIWDATGVTPVQVYPVTPGTRATVVLTACPGGDKLGTGHYVARWTVPGGSPIGTYQVRWFFKHLVGSVEQTFTEDFEVLTVAGSGQVGYALVSDLRGEGVTTAQATDQRLQTLIFRASRYIDMVTRQWFEPRQRTITIDGTGAKCLFFNVPIVAVEEILVDGTLVDPTTYKVYNRHLSQGLHAPDDRQNPRIEFLSNRPPNWIDRLSEYSVWASGEQNVEITGVFGYTEVPHGSVTSVEGITPEMIKQLCMMLVIRNLAPLGDVEAQQDARNRSRLISESTRDQSYTLSSSGRESQAGVAPFTGDPEIDALLCQFMAPLSIGSSSGGAPY